MAAIARSDHSNRGHESISLPSHGRWPQPEPFIIIIGNFTTMATTVGFRNPNTGEIKAVKIGWSWPLFLFSSLFGAPLFMRQLHVMGSVLLGLCLANVALVVAGEESQALNALSMVSSLSILAISIYLGMNGNELTAKNYLSSGWEIAFPDAPGAAEAREAWSLS